MTTDGRTGVAALAGRRIDAEGSTESRFPIAAVELVRNDIRRLIMRHDVGTLVCSAACGADIVALEVAVELELRVVIVLPFDRARFRSTSVVDRGGKWGERFDALLSSPNPKREIIVLNPPAGSEDAAYAQGTRRIIAEAEQRAPTDESPIAITVWEGHGQANMDATQAFIDQARAAGMRSRVVISNPAEAARRYLNGGTDAPEHALDTREALVRSDPVLANQLAREVAGRLLHGGLKMSPDTVRRTWKACKQVEAFGFARRILRRSIQQLGSTSPATLTELCQQQALCTSKDPDLSAAIRHDWALKILKPDDEKLKNDSEHQGIAGGIWKRRWEWDGSRVSLEKSLRHYKAGIPAQRKEQQQRDFSKNGYVEINCAFVLDLLGSLAQDADTASRYKEDANDLRAQLTALQPTDDQDKWSHATLAEACLGLGRFDEAVKHIQTYVGRDPDPWELDTTLRQLVRLAHLRGIPDQDVRPVLQAALPKHLQETNSFALTSLLIGKVGLALSGGGFRASLFHLGVLARLAEQDVLRHVEMLSCVSGGSIVGALYYQHLKHALEEHGEDLKPLHYVELVERVICDFVKGVSRNVRTGLLTNLQNTLAIISGDDREYARAVAVAFHRTFYAKLDAEPTHMDQLTVRPKEGPVHFHPGRHNWIRKNKVPSLVLNAATLNTGHSWQFTARSMGESPFTIQAAVDSNVRLRRANYSPQLKRRVGMSEAVAASACVPGLFAPLQLDELYDGFLVRLVDGGVFDNQGASSLIEQDCQVLLVSDAAGQLFAESTARSGHVSPLLRSIGVFQERIRQTGYEALMKRQEAGQVRCLVYTHLTQGLGVPPLDWRKCEDPHQDDDQLPETLDEQVSTGVDRELQICLAKMRTDLDIFSEIECAALMASGYLSIQKPLEPLLTLLHTQTEVDTQEPIPPIAAPFWFSELLPLMQAPNRSSPAYRLLRKHLNAGALGVGRLLKLDDNYKAVAFGVGGVLVLALAGAVYAFRDAPLWTVGSAGVLALIVALRQLASRVGNWLGNLIDVVTDPAGTFKGPFYRYFVAMVMTGVAIIVVRCLDPKYLQRGSLEVLRRAKQ